MRLPEKGWSIGSPGFFGRRGEILSWSHIVLKKQLPFPRASSSCPAAPVELQPKSRYLFPQYATSRLDSQNSFSIWSARRETRCTRQSPIERGSYEFSNRCFSICSIRRDRLVRDNFDWALSAHSPPPSSSCCRADGTRVAVPAVEHLRDANHGSDRVLLCQCGGDFIGDCLPLFGRAQIVGDTLGGRLKEFTDHIGSP